MPRAGLVRRALDNDLFNWPRHPSRPGPVSHESLGTQSAVCYDGGIMDAPFRSSESPPSSDQSETAAESQQWQVDPPAPRLSSAHPVATTAAASRRAVRWLAALSSAGILAYALPTLFALPPVTPAMLVSGDFHSLGISRLSSVVQSAAVLVYASALLPLVLLYATAELRHRPVTTAVVASALGVATGIEIFAYLPVLALQLHPVPAPPPALVDTLRQTAWVRFVALDIAGFTIAFGAGCACAILYRRRFPRLARAFLGSIALFLLHLPLLPFAPAFATALMALSVCLCISLPLMIAALTVPVTTPSRSLPA